MNQLQVQSEWVDNLLSLKVGTQCRGAIHLTQVDHELTVHAADPVEGYDYYCEVLLSIFCDNESPDSNLHSVETEIYRIKDKDVRMQFSIEDFGTQHWTLKFIFRQDTKGTPIHFADTHIMIYSPKSSK